MTTTTMSLTVAKADRHDGHTVVKPTRRMLVQPSICTSVYKLPVKSERKPDSTQNTPDRVGVLPPLSQPVTTVTWYNSANYASTNVNNRDVTQLFRHGVRTPLSSDVNAKCRLQCQLNIDRLPNPVSPGQPQTTEPSEMCHPQRTYDHDGGSRDVDAGHINSRVQESVMSRVNANSPSTVFTSRSTRVSINSVGTGRSYLRQRGDSVSSRSLGSLSTYRWRSCDENKRDATDVLYRNTYLSDGKPRINPRSGSTNERPWSTPNGVLTKGMPSVNEYRFSNATDRNNDIPTNHDKNKVMRKSKSLNIDDTLLNVKPIYKSEESLWNNSTQMTESDRMRGTDRVGGQSPLSMDSSIYTHSDRSAQLYVIPNERATTIEFQPIVIQRPLKQEKTQHYRQTSKTQPKTPVFQGGHEQTQREYKSVEAYQRFLDSARQNTPVSPSPSVHRSSTAPSDSYMFAQEHSRMIQSVTEYNRPNPPPSPELKTDVSDVINVPLEWMGAENKQMEFQPTVVPLRDVH